MIRDNLDQWISLELWHLPEWYSRREIAKLIGCSKSPSLLNVLGEAVKEGKLEQAKRRDKYNRMTILYRISSAFREAVFSEIEKHTHGEENSHA